METDYGGSAELLWVGITSVLLILVCFFFSLCETAVVNSNESRLKALSGEGNKGAARVLNLRKKPLIFLATVQSGLTISTLIVVVLSIKFYSELLDTPVRSLGVSGGGERVIADIIVVAICAFLIIVFGHLLPKRLALINPERTALFVSKPIQICGIILRPLVVILTGTTGLLLRLFGKPAKKTQNNITEAELRLMVSECSESSGMEVGTKNLLGRVFEFGDLTVGEILTHRRNIVAVPDTASRGELVKVATDSGFSRIPVYHEDIDNITGFVYVKDLLKYVGNTVDINSPIDKSMLRDAVFIPKTKLCSQMFDYMTKNHVQIAVVVDEYGGTNGIVTMEDLVEAILGSIQDEYDHEDDAIERVDDNSFTVDGSAALTEISELIGRRLESETSDTIAGLMLERMGHIPQEGEHPSVVINGTRFTVQTVHDRRIEKVLVVAHK